MIGEYHNHKYLQGIILKENINNNKNKWNDKKIS